MFFNLLAAVEWNDVADGIYVLVGAILGVLSSLLIEWGVKKYGIFRLKKMLRIELKGIKQGVEENIEDSGEIIFTSPIWSFIGQTSTLLDLKENDYKKIVAIHGAIIEFKASEQNVMERTRENRQKFINKINNNIF